VLRDYALSRDQAARAQAGSHKTGPQSVAVLAIVVEAGRASARRRQRASAATIDAETAAGLAAAQRAVTAAEAVLVAAREHRHEVVTAARAGPHGVLWGGRGLGGALWPCAWWFRGPGHQAHGHGWGGLGGGGVAEVGLSDLDDGVVDAVAV
jgi:hypothetical protein